MSIKYVVAPSGLRPGEFYPRPVSLTTRNLRQLIEEISNSTTLSSPDVKAVIDALIGHVQSALLNGDRVSLDGFLDIRPRMSQKLTSADEPFSIGTGGSVFVSATVKPSLTKSLRSKVQFEMVPRVRKIPNLLSFEDARSKEKGLYSAGGNARLIGHNMQIFDESVPDEGIFFIATSGAETKVEIIQDNGSKRLTFEIPGGLNGAQQVEVRTRYTEGGDLRVGRMEQAVMPV